MCRDHAPGGGSGARSSSCSKPTRAEVHRQHDRRRCEQEDRQDGNETDDEQQDLEEEHEKGIERVAQGENEGVSEDHLDTHFVLLPEQGKEVLTRHENDDQDPDPYDTDDLGPTGGTGAVEADVH